MKCAFIYPPVAHLKGIMLRIVKPVILQNPAVGDKVVSEIIIFTIYFKST